MKLKGEKELLAEEMYESIELELYKLTKEETVKAGDLVDDLTKEDYEQIGQVLDEIYSSNSLLYTYRKTAEALLQGDFTLDEIRILYEYSQENRCVKVISSILEDNKENINLNNIDLLFKFIKTLLILKVKDREYKLQSV